MEDILKSISVNDLEKLKLLLSILPRQEQKEVVTLRVFASEYGSLIKQNRSKAYYVSVECALKHLTDFFGQQKSINGINLKETENFVTHLQQKVRKGYWVYYRTLKAAFNKAVDWGYVKDNYFHKVKLPKKQKVNPVFINSDQLLVISDRLENQIVKDVVVFAFYTGMRLNEIINLAWRNVDLTTKTITVGDENFTTKGRNQRYIPISEEVFEILKRIENEKQKEIKKIRLVTLAGDASTIQQNSLQASLIMTKGYVFCKKNGTRYCGNYISRKFKKACTTTSVEKEIHFHSLRHSFASNLAQKGVSLYTIKELLGHSSITTTEIYSHLNMDCLREAVKRLDVTHVHTPSPSEPPPESSSGQALSRRELNEVKIFRINSGEGK